MLCLGVYNSEIIELNQNLLLNLLSNFSCSILIRKDPTGDIGTCYQLLPPPPPPQRRKIDKELYV